jgi:hypothetical protein
MLSSDDPRDRRYCSRARTRELMTLMNNESRSGLVVGGLDNRYDVVRALGPDDLLDRRAVLLGSFPVGLRPFDRVLDVENPFLGELEKSDVDLPSRMVSRLEGFPY